MSMKKSTVRFAILLILTSSTYTSCRAQEAKPLEMGVKVGLNISDLYTNDTSISDLIYGFNAGVYAKLLLTKLFAIQSEFYLSTKGASIRYNDLLLDGTANFHLTYLELPVLSVIKLSRQLKLEFGPYVSCLVGAKVKNVANINHFNFEQNVDVNKFNRLDAGFIIGSGIVVHTVTVGVRYTYGFVKVGNTQTFIGESYTIPNTNNGVVSFYLAVPLNKMKKDPITNQYTL